MASICIPHAARVIILICLLNFDLCHPTPFFEFGQGLGDLREHLDRRLESFRADLHKSFQGQHQRIRREASVEDLVGDVVGREPLLSDKLTVLAHFFVNLQDYVIVGRKQSVDGSSYTSSAEIRRFDGANYTTTDEFQTYGVADIEAHLVGGHIYIAVANQLRDPGLYDGMSYIYRFDDTTETVTLVQQILTKGASDFQFFDFEGDGYLALANFRGDGYAKYRAKLEIYVFSGAHFDLVATTETFGATAITTLEIEWEPYIVVAQYIDIEGQHDVGSVVYRFDTDTDTLIKVQTLVTSAPLDIEAFYMNGNHYLAVANSGEVGATGAFQGSTDSIIYWWTGFQFVEYQRIATENATQWEQMELPNGEVLLFLSDSQGVTIYEFTIDAEWEPASSQVPSIPSTTGQASTVVVDAVNGLFLVVADSESVTADYTNGTTNVYQIVTSVASPYIRPPDAVSACIRRAESQLDTVSSSVEELSNKLQDALKLDGDQEINSQVQFTGKVTAEKMLTMENLTITEEYSFNIDRDVIENSIQIDNEITDLLAEKDDVVTISGAETISSPLIFTQVVLSDNTTVVDTNSDTGRINGIHIRNLNDSVVWLTGDQTIDGLTDFTQNVTIASSNLDVDGDINGIDVPGDVMTINGTQTAQGWLTFTSATTFDGNVTVDGLVNGLNLSTDVVVTHRDHVIHGAKTVNENLDMVEDAVVAEGKLVDTEDLSLFEGKLISLTDGGTMSGVITLQGVSDINGQLLTDLIDDVNITELNENAVFKNTVQSISGTKTFVGGSFNTSKDLIVTGNINNVSLSQFVLLDTPGADISTPIRFAQNLHMQSDMNVTGLVNGIDIPQDVVTINGAQTISESVTFSQDFTVIGDIDITENLTIAGYDISELPLDTVSVSSSEQQVIGGVKNFTVNTDVQGNITVQELISGVNLTLLQQQILSLTRPQVIDLPVEVQGRLVIQGDLQLVNDTIDGYRLSQDFVRLDDVSDIKGYKIFKNHVDISGDLNLDPGIKISGVDLPDLNRTVIKLIAVQTIGGEVVMEENADLKGNLSIDGLVNGLDISRDVVTLSGNQNITGDVKFHSAEVLSKCYVHNLNVSSEVDGVNLDDLYSSAVMMQGERVTILSPVTFDQLEVNDQLAVTGTVDGVDVEDFAANVVTLSGNQTINGVLDFLSYVDFSRNLTVLQNVSGIHFDSLIGSVILKDTDGPIRGEKIFKSNVTVDGSITVDDLTNGVDLEVLNGVYLSRTLPQSLNGLKTFTASISLDNLNLSLGATLNGIVPSVDLVLLTTGEEVINGTLWFSSFLEVDGNLTIAETINDVDLLQLYNSVVWLTGKEQNITQPWTLEGGMHVIGNISMEEGMEVNGVDVSDLPDNLVSSSRNRSIGIPAVFNGTVTVAGDLLSLGLFNGVNISFLYEDAVRSGPAQTIQGDKDFAGNMTVQRLEVETNMISTLIKGTANLKHLLDNTVSKSTAQRLKSDVVFKDDVIFKQDVTVNGLVEGIDLSEEAVLKHTDQALTGANVFEDGFRVLGNISATGTIDTVDVALLGRCVFLVDRSQTVEGSWVFHDDVTVNGDITGPGTVNGIDISTELVTLTGTHEINGSKTFSGYVTVQGDLLVDLVNSVNLVVFELDIVHTVGDFTITGDKVFANNVTLLANATVLGLVDGIDIQQMYVDHQDIGQVLYEQIAELNDTLRSMCLPIASLLTAVQGQPVQLSYWEEEEFLNNSLATNRYDSLAVEGGILVAFVESSEAIVHDCIKTTLYLCVDDAQSGCHEVSDESLSAASNVELFEYDDDVFIVLALSLQTSTCTSTTGVDDEVQIVKMSNATYDVRLPAQHPIDTATFVIDGTVYIAVANLYDPVTGDKNVPSVVYEFDPVSGDFTELQEIATTGSTAVTHLEHDGNNWIAFTCTPESTYSLILKWNDTINQFVLEASILTDAASDVLGMVVEDVPLMLFANEKQLSRHGTVDLNQPIVIYEYSDRLGWTLKQNLDAIGIIQLEAFLINSISYLVAVSNRGAIDIYKWSGASQFEFYKSLPVADVASVHLFVHWDELHMAVARPIFHAIITDESVASAKAVIRGQNENTVLEVL